MIKNNIRNIIYIVFFLLSIILIGLYFICPNCAWYIVSCSIGASLLGAVALGFFLDLTINMQNKKILKVANLNIFSEINNLLTIINRVIRISFNRLKLGSFEFEGKNIKELFKFYANAIHKIKEQTAPLVANNGVLTQEELDYMRLAENGIEYLNDTNSELKESRERFDELKKNFEINKNILLINNIATENQINTLSNILSELRLQEETTFEKIELFDYENLLVEFEDNIEVINTLNAIGFADISFDNKNRWLKINWSKRKRK